MSRARRFPVGEADRHRRFTAMRMGALFVIASLMAVGCASSDGADLAADGAESAEPGAASPDADATSDTAGDDAADDDAAVETATIRLAPWGPKLIDFVDLYVAQEEGYFADESIDL